MAMKEVEADLVQAAIAGTENEIFSEATGAEPTDADENEGPGDLSPETMGDGLEGQHEPGADKGDDADGDGKGDDADRDPKTGQFVAKKEGEEDDAADTDADADDDADKDAAADPKAGDKKPAQQQADPQRDQNGRVPPGVHREATQRARAAEERATKAEQLLEQATTKLSSFEQRISDFLAGKGQQPAQQVQQQQEPAAPPDMFADPEGYQRWHADQLSQARNQGANTARELFLNASLADAHETHGKDFEEGYSALTSLPKADPSARATVQKIMGAPNPGRALMKWHNEQKALKEVGGDPKAYRDRVLNEERERLKKDPEFRAQLLEELRTEASGTNGRPARTVTRVPSINGARGGGSGQLPDRRATDGSEKGVFESAFEED